MDIPRLGTEPTFLYMYRGKKFSAFGHGESSDGFTAPGHGTNYIEGKKFAVLGRGEFSDKSTTPGHGTDSFSLLREGENFSALGHGESSDGSVSDLRVSSC